MRLVLLKWWEIKAWRSVWSAWEMWLVSGERWEGRPSCGEMVLWLVSGRPFLHRWSGGIRCGRREEGYGWTLCRRPLRHLVDHVWPLNVVQVLNVGVVWSVSTTRHLWNHVLAGDVVGLLLWSVLVLFVDGYVGHQAGNSTNKLVPFLLLWHPASLFWPPSNDDWLWGRPLCAS